MNKTHRSIFLREVKEAFPQVRDDLNAEHGLLHGEMHAFHSFVQNLISNGDKDELILAFQIIERHFLNGNDELVNAINVSFLEHLDSGLAKGAPSWAYKYFPKSLLPSYEELRKYHGN